jgi:undecaprenyl-diphosphatase
MLAITAARLGVSVAVSTAVEAVGKHVVATALPRLQPLALTRSTRAAVREADCLEDLRNEVQRITGAAIAPVEDLERIKPRTVLTIVMAALGLWALLPQILGAGDVWAQTRSANLWWALAALGLSLVTYLGAALALDGSLPERLPLAPNVGVQFATSFVGVAAPGGALALTARFLQRRGIDPALAVAAVGVDTLAGVMVHFSLLGVFVAWAGSSGLKTFNVPSLGIIGLIAVGVAAVAALLTAVPRSRALLAARLLPATKRAVHGIAETARHPANLVELFGGSFAITLGYLLALQVSVLAFGSSPPFTSVALVYLVGSVVSSVAPTPGGIGAVEATLVAGLTSAGMRSDTALGAVMLYRLATFWLPMVPGWMAFTMLQRTGDI